MTTTGQTELSSLDTSEQPRYTKPDGWAVSDSLVRNA